MHNAVLEEKGPIAERNSDNEDEEENSEDENVITEESGDNEDKEVASTSVLHFRNEMPCTS